MSEKNGFLIIGHLGFETITTPFGSGGGLGGAAYYGAVGASLFSSHVVVGGSVGTDFPLSDLEKIGIDLSGVSVVSGKSPCFNIRYLPTFDHRNVEFDIGVGNQIDLSSVVGRNNIGFIHIATNLPDVQFSLVRQLRSSFPSCMISVDCFDQFIESEWEGVARVIRSVDMVFANEREMELLRRKNIDLPGSTVEKRGERGAVFSWPGGVVTAGAPIVDVVDPTGAGDVFAGVFIACISRGQPFAEALQTACFAASEVVTDFSARAILNKGGGCSWIH